MIEHLYIWLKIDHLLFFKGLNFNADFIVTELGELKGSIQDIAFLVMMLMVQQKVMQGDRSQETGIIIDEAADKLKGKHGADFIEGFIRRVRKNKGALSNIITQFLALDCHGFIWIHIEVAPCSRVVYLYCLRYVKTKRPPIC